MIEHPLIVLENLQFAYHSGQPAVLRDLSVHVPAGTVTAVLGPNGAGKTTLLRILLGYLRPQAGRVLLHGKPQKDYTRSELSRMVGLVPQNEHIPFDYTSLEFVLLGRTPYLGPLEMPGEADFRIAENALKSLDILDLRDRPVPELSGGECQLVLLARVLTQQTRILLLDEPTTHLDLSNKARLLKTLVWLAEQGRTVVFTTHDPEAAIACARYLILMRDGRIQDCGPIDDLLTSEKLSAIYAAEVEVARVNGRPVVLLH